MVGEDHGIGTQRRLPDVLIAPALAGAIILRRAQHVVRRLVRHLVDFPCTIGIVEFTRVPFPVPHLLRQIHGDTGDVGR